MQTEQFTVANVKCGGCVKAIVDGLGGLEGINKVEVTIDDGKIEIEGDNLSRDAIASKLSELGYPEV
jgi:copper chaperone